ncbi:hypothetical protein HD806DRAFT_553350 [Xylariaceae sp. AK1471]|nr:hypothetical protein HD806DRAFT_553350 [Xylariaceae sp. AK1471]
MDKLAKKRVKTTDSLPSTKKKRPRPKSPLPGSYSRDREGQGAAALTAPATPISPPLPVSLATTAVDDTCLWGDPSRWSSAMSLASPTSWDHQQNMVATTTSPSLATHDRGHFTFSTLPSAELTFPIITTRSVVVGDNNYGGEGGISGDSSPESLEKWHAHSTPPPPFVSLVSHPSMSYTDAHTHTQSQAQSTDLIEQPFSPGSDVADFAPGFKGPGFGVASNFEPLIVNHPGTSATAFLHGKLDLHEDDTSPSAVRFPVGHYHSGHTHVPDQYLGQSDYRFFANHEPWYNAEASVPSLDLIPTTHLSSQSCPSHVGELGFGDGPEPSSAAFSDPHSTLVKSPLGTKFERTRRPRGQLQPKDREETSKTRKLKACIRCRMQKIRCTPDPSKPETECCLCCRKVLMLETKKVIHRIPCLRWNLNEVVLFRVGGLGFTQRWAGVCVENIESGDWADERVITIGVGITKLLCDPMELKVRRFKPNSTDIQHRHWKDQETETQFVITMPAYALADVNDTSEAYRRYVGENAEEAIRRLTRDTEGNEYVRRTFSAADSVWLYMRLYPQVSRECEMIRSNAKFPLPSLRHAAKMAHASFNKNKVIPARLFRSYFRLWFASPNLQRGFTLGSAYVAKGHENLEGTSHAPLCRGKQFVSRMITAQFDSIGYKHVLVKLKRAVLDELWLMMQKRCPETFFTVYLIVFMMLHEIAIACQDRRRRAKEQGLTQAVAKAHHVQQTYYDLEDATAKIKHGADIILGHWHYYKGDLDPLSMSLGSITKAFGDEYMDEDEIQLLIATRHKYDQMKKKRKEIDWEEDPLYLVSQMFEQNWRPMQSCWP